MNVIDRPKFGNFALPATVLLSICALQLQICQIDRSKTAFTASLFLPFSLAVLPEVKLITALEMKLSSLLLDILYFPFFLAQLAVALVFVAVVGEGSLLGVRVHDNKNILAAYAYIGCLGLYSAVGGGGK